MIGLHTQSGAAISPTLIFPERYAWLHIIHHRLAPTSDFIQDLGRLMTIYHPQTKLLNPPSMRINAANQYATPPNLQTLIQRAFLTSNELLFSPLNCSMEGNIAYCTAFP